jgi:hypothetical protein
MRFDRQKAFPYPVLRPDIDDYKNAEFQVTVDVASTKDNKKIEANVVVALSSEEINHQIDNGNAAITIIFACRDTYFREAVTTKNYEWRKSFDSGEFRGEVIIYPFVVALKPIKDFSAKGINAEFKRDKFSFEVGEVLAADEPKVIYIDRELFKPISSIVQLVKLDTLTGFEWRLRLEDDKIKIMLSAEAKQAIDLARNNKRHQVFLINSLYFAAIMEAIQKFKEDAGTYGSLRWAKVLQQQCHNAAIDLSTHDAYLIAQRLLKTPLGLAKQYVFGEDSQ